MTGLGERIGDLWNGARAGLVATVAMSLLMLAGRAAGITGELPPRKAVDKAAKELPATDRPRGADREALAGLSHFAFGAGVGALFGLLTSGLHRLWISVGLGVAYGMLVYAISYIGVIPSLDMLPEPSDDRRGRVAIMLTGHLVFGSVLGGLLALGRRRAHVKRSLE